MPRINQNRMRICRPNKIAIPQGGYTHRDNLVRRETIEEIIKYFESVNYIMMGKREIIEDLNKFKEKSK